MNFVRIYDSILDRIAPELADHRELDRLCESPIEVALGVALVWTSLIVDRNRPLIVALQNERDHYGSDSHLLIPQFEWKNRRIDFAVMLLGVSIFVECDGHDFHERTKEQAARDRSKDRQIQRGGFPILRFTGSEIFQNAGACAEEVFDLQLTIFGETHG